MPARSNGKTRNTPSTETRKAAKAKPSPAMPKSFTSPPAKSAAASTSPPLRGSDKALSDAEQLARSRAEKATICARNYQAKYGSEEDDGEPLFFPRTTPKGQRVWQMSGKLYEKEADLLHYTDTYSGKDKDACRALARFVEGCEKGLLFDGIDWETVEQERAEDAISFLLPIAAKLTGIIEGSPEDAVKKKDRVLQWVDEVIQKTFSLRFLPEKDVKRALKIIPIALYLCNLHNCPPKKKEIFDEARRRDKKLFDVVDTTERRVLGLAGLKALEKVRSGGRPKK